MEPMATRSWSKCDTIITLGLLGGTIGAAGWIIGAVLELIAAPLQPAGILLDIAVVFLCAVGVLLTGLFIWSSYLSGSRLSCFVIIETLLGASFAFGVVAIAWMQEREVLIFALGSHFQSGQPGNEVWEAIGRHVVPEVAWAAPVDHFGDDGRHLVASPSETNVWSSHAYPARHTGEHRLLNLLILRSPVRPSSVDGTSAPNASTRTLFGVSDRRAQIAGATGTRATARLPAALLARHVEYLVSTLPLAERLLWG